MSVVTNRCVLLIDEVQLTLMSVLYGAQPFVVLDPAAADLIIALALRIRSACNTGSL